LINPTLDQRFPDHKEIGIATCSDWHMGSMTCMESACEKWVKQIEKDGHLVVLMGDLIENSLPGSAGSVWEQKTPPKQQIDAVTQILEPVKDRIIGAVGGNHSARTVRAVGIDPDELICFNLGTQYFGHTMAGRIQVGNAHWKIMAHHGAGGGSLLGSKLNVIAEKMTKVMPMMDLYLAGHTHADVAGSDIRHDIAMGGRPRIVKQRRHFSGTGSLLSYDGSYAEAKILPPASPVQVVHFIGDRVHKALEDERYDKPYRRVPVYFWS
jgi:hypothetical protein